MSEAQVIVAAVIVESDGRVVIARRPEGKHQGGLWEFPGGKLEAGEGPEVGLRRELAEELAIRIDAMRPLIRVEHDYGDKRVQLDVWRVEGEVSGDVGREGQPLRRLTVAELNPSEFPAANGPIIRAAQLPEHYLITPDPGPREQWPQFLQHLERCLENGARLIQLRGKSLDGDDYRELAVEVLARCRKHGTRLLLNADAKTAIALGADGVQLSSGALRRTEGPLPSGLLVGASAHDEAELTRAAAIGADFALLSPVQATASHPDTVPLGWECFAELVSPVNMPVYALGGLDGDELELAWTHGAQGVSAIRGLWKCYGGQ